MGKNYKKLMAVTLTAAMTMASTMIASAEDLTGDGGFEGVEMQNPPIQVSLPTTANIDYIADPNNLIQSTMSGDVALRDEYAGISFSGDAGIYFPTQVSGDAVLAYTNESQELKAYNRSRQAIKFTVKLEANSSGDASLVYASGDVFDNSGDTARKVYFGITDGVSGDAAISAAGASGVATFQTEVDGTEENFKKIYSGDAYQYAVKDEVAASGDAAWQHATYKLKGAANTWGDWGKDKNLAFPQLKITWTYADASGAADANTIAYSGSGDLAIPYSQIGASSASEITDAVFDWGGGNFTSPNLAWGGTRTDAVVIGTDSITLKHAGLLEYCGTGVVYLNVILNGDSANPVTLTINIP